MTPQQGIVSEDLTLHDILAGESDEPRDVFALERLPDAVAKLDARERQIIRLRFTEELTLAEVGEVLGLSRERIRQIEIEALRKLRARILGKERMAS